MVSMALDMWVTSILILFMLTYIYKENPLYRFAEYTLIGISGGMVLLGGYKRVMGSAIQPILEGEVVYIIGLILGLVMLTRFFKEYSWISRYSVSILTGIGVGILIPTMAASDVIEQIHDTMLPLSGGPVTIFNNLVQIVIVCSVVFYFVFTRQPKTAVETYVRRFARAVIMAAFGVGIGSQVITYSSNALSSMSILLVDWLGLG